MHIVCSYTSGYFSIYDDGYGCVHYDDYRYHHALYDILGFADLRTSYVGQLAQFWWVQVIANCLGDSHSHVWVVCREVLHIQFFPDWRPPL